MCHLFSTFVVFHIDNCVGSDFIEILAYENVCNSTDFCTEY